MTRNDIDKAERNSRLRAILMAAGAVPLAITAVIGFGDEASSMSPILRHGVWAALVLVWLLILATGGGLRLSNPVRRLMNDEVAQLNRSRAIQLGFWTAMALAVLLYFVSLQWPLTGRESLRILVNLSLAAALVRYAWLEWR